MNGPAIISWLKTARGATAGATALLCGILVAVYSGFTLGNPPDETYRLDFSGAHWIGMAGDRDGAYFRKQIFITGTVRQAWIYLAGTDIYDAYVNGFPLRLPSQPGATNHPLTGVFCAAEPATQFDLTPFLTKGQNSITIHVLRRLRTRPPQLLVKGFVSDSNETQWIYSDAGWKAKAQPDDTVGIYTWLQPTFDDSGWPKALALDRRVPDPDLLPVPVSPAVFAHPLEGSWIGSPNVGAGQCCFRRDFTVPWRTDSTWLEIAATGSYRIYLNGSLVSRSDLVLYSQPNLAMGSINLRRWLHLGGNRLEIQVENGTGENALFANVCFTRGDRVAGVLPSDASWQVQSIPMVRSDEPWIAARELAAYGDAPYGNQMKLSYPPLLSSSEISQRNACGVAVGILVSAAWIFFGLGFSRRLARHRGIAVEEALAVDALAQIPVGIVAGLLVLASFDIRIRPDAPFHLSWLVVLLFFAAWLRWRVWRWRPAPSGVSLASRLPHTVGFIRSYGFGMALAGIVVFAFLLRAGHLMNYPLDHDEVFMRNVTHGIVERGYPSLAYKGHSFRLSTYELIPWPEAFCAILTGWPDWSLRVPALLFGTGACAALGLMGAHLFNRRTGLFAALVYACLAFDVLWSRHCFHLQQTQFFALLTFFAYYETIHRGGGVDRRYFPLTCALFCLTYLSWEGSGFILPVFAVVIVAMNPGDWSWLRQIHFWIGFFFTSAVVLIQLSARSIALPPYRGMGTGLSDISGPTLNLLDQRNNDFFYINGLMQMPSQFLLSLLALAGLPLFWRQKPMRYVLLVFFLLLLCYSNLLPIFSIRYAYFYQPLLVLGGCAVAIQFYDRIALLTTTAGTGTWDWTAAWARRGIALVIVLVFLAASEIGVQFYRVEATPEFPRFMTRYHDSYYDYQTPSRYVSARWRPGDGVIAMMPDTYFHFTGQPAVICNTTYNKRVVFEPYYDTPVYIDGHSGSPVLRDFSEVKDFYSRHNRVWFVAESSAFFKAQDRNTLQMVLNISRLVYENGSGAVFLWDNGGDPSALASLMSPDQPGPYGAIPKPASDHPSFSLPTPPAWPVEVTLRNGL
jgi:hypothetical protein